MNYKIEIFRSHIEINDYNLGDSVLIENCFSIYDQLYHVRNHFGMHYDEEKRKLYLPRGIDIPWLESIFGISAYMHVYPIYKELPTITLPTTRQMKFEPRDDTQVQTIDFMCNTNNYSYLFGTTLQSVNLDTGKGKTFCSIASMLIYNMRTIIITSINEWLEQWKNSILKFTNIEEREIKIINGSGSINVLNKINTDNYRIYLVNHSTLKSYAENNGWESIGKLFNKLKIGIKLYDESHLNFENMSFIDFYSDVFKTFYVTATPYRSDEKESKIYNLYMKNVPSINLFDAYTDPHSIYMAVKFNSHPTAQDIKHCKGSYGLNIGNYIRYLMNNDNFYKMSYILISKFLNKNNGKLLIYIGLNEAILTFKNWMENNFPNLIGNIGIYTSLSPDKRSELDNRVILSTTKSAGAASDIDSLEMVINLAEPFKSNLTAKQTLGRLRKPNTVYIDLIDTGFYYTKKFYNEKKPVYMKYATKCIEISLKDKDIESEYKTVYESNNAIILDPIFFSDNGKLDVLSFEE